ncbi:MAG: glucokinase [Rhodobacter sp.]|nr:glucokinase [Paracoccaceae bacterium]MCB1408546.1 glucokinase [Paracoccaceae bacterium]MCC0078834.1 glucokinase [Rhodobacter sp.]
MPDRILKPWPFTPAPQLVADIGGTNTRVALADSGVLRQGSIRRYRNAGRASVSEILRAYLAETATTDCAGVCVAVAGPVRDGVAQMTNLSWTIAAPDLAAVAGTERVAILNDLQAQGHALHALDPRHLRPLLPGRPADATATQLVVGAGTGFNAAPVHHLPHGTHVAASECGHIHLPQQGEQEQALARHLTQRHGIATIEEVLSGRGLVALHHWITGEDLPAEHLTAAIAAGEPGMRDTGVLYARVLGRTLANLALTHLPFGGLYLIGSVARTLAPVLVDLGMGETFAEMGRFSPLMAAFPVLAVEDDYAALLGCAAHLTALP